MAMQEFTELGSGFNLAMRDLEIRGAGNLLGGEQSGFIAEMGFETYTRILEEAVTELREEEFRDHEQPQVASRPQESVVDVDIDALIPRTYVSDNDARLELYRRLYAVTAGEQVDQIGDELRDRFGPLPAEARSLLGVLRLRLAASALSCRRVKLSGSAMELDIVPDPDRWDGGSAAAFASAINAVRTRKVSVIDTKEGMRLRLSLNREADPLTDAVQALREVETPLRLLSLSSPLPNALQ